MMRVFYLIAITLTIGFFVADFYYAEEVSHARYSSYDGRRALDGVIIKDDELRKTYNDAIKTMKEVEIEHKVLIGVMSEEEGALETVENKYVESLDKINKETAEKLDKVTGVFWTVEAGFVTMGFFLMCVVLYILSLVKIKTTTMKVFSIIGLSLTGIMILWDGVMIASPSGISFNEVVPGWIFFGVAMLAFMIIGTIHAFKKKA